MPATQLQLDFNIHPAIRAVPSPPDTTWQDVTHLACRAGVRGACLVNADLLDALDDQSLYDAIWTANFTLSLDYSECVRFSLALPDRLLTLKAIQTNHALRLGRVTDFLTRRFP
jgi:hypothetical protein